MQKIISFIYEHKIPLLLLAMGCVYTWFIVYIHNVTEGDYQDFVRYPFSWEYGVDRWFTWSSRLLIESSVNIFAHHLFLWKLVTIALGGVLFWSLGRLLRIKSAQQCMLFFGLMLLINMHILATAGVFATTINYLWPAACFAFALAVVLIPLKNNVMKITTQIAAWPAYIFAVCNEQIAIMSVIFIGAIILYRLYKRQRISVILWLFLLISTLGVVNVLFSPGNAVRKAQEVTNWWVGYDALSILYKIEIGVVVTFSRLFAAPSLPAIALIFILLVASYKLRNKAAFTAILPAAVIVFLFFFPSTYGTTGTPVRQHNYFNQISQQSMTFEPTNLPSKQMIREYLIVYGAITISIVASLVYFFNKRHERVIILTVLGAGFITACVICFTPTLFGSGIRTLYVFMISMVCVCYIIFNKMFESDFVSKQKHKIKA